jgi:hypothetical protein
MITINHRTGERRKKIKEIQVLTAEHVHNTVQHIGKVEVVIVQEDILPDNV